MVEHISKKHGLSAYVLGLPKSKWDLLPPHIRPIEFGRELPEFSAILIDEAALAFYSRDVQKRLNKKINTALSLARQKDQTIFFAGHTLRAVDIGIVMNADAVMMKEPSRLLMTFERAEIRGLAHTAWQRFDGVKDPLERKRRTVVFSDEMYGEVMENPLPSFWSEQLSKAWGAVPLAEPEAKPAGRPELTEWDKEILRRILELEGKRDFFEGIGWERERVGASRQQIERFLALGLVAMEFKSRSTKGYRASVEKIREALGNR